MTMAKETKPLNKRQMIRERARAQRRRRKIIPLAILVAGLVFISASLYWIASGSPAKAARDYRPEDVSSERPLLAVHEMEPFNPASVPFLPKDGPQPKIALSETLYNFGSIGLNDVVTMEFVIANQGAAPLTISRAYTTCGCTTAEFTATIIPPGQVSIMNLVFDAGFHFTGGQTVKRGVIIESNDPRNPQTEIWVQASVRTTP
jgi:hypothetical protein